MIRLNAPKRCLGKEEKMSQWIDLDNDDLVCEICEEKETVYPYCVNCVNKHLTLMSLFSNGWDYSESAKLRVYEAICEAHRETRRAGL